MFSNHRLFSYLLVNDFFSQQNFQVTIFMTISINQGFYKYMLENEIH